MKNLIYIAILLLPFCVKAQCNGTLNSNLLTVTTYPDFLNGICPADPVDFTAVIGPTTSTTVVYQWEESVDGITWTSILGETTESYIVTGPANGNQYRFQVSEAVDAGNPLCTFTSSPMIINYYDISSNIIAPILECDTDGIPGEEFDLTSRIPEIINGDDPANYTITFHSFRPDAQAGINPILAPTSFLPPGNPWTVYVRVVNNVKGCVSNAPPEFILNYYTTPPINAVIPPLSQCDVDLDGISVFNLNDANALIISDPSQFNITYYNTLAGAQSQDLNDEIQDLTAYTNPPPPQPQEVYAYVVNDNGCSGVAVTVPLEVTSAMILGTPKFIDQCDDNTGGGAINDGIGTFNLTSVRDDIINDYPAGNYEVVFYQNEEDATAQINQVPLIGFQNTTSPFTQDLFVRVNNLDNNGSCAGLGQHVTLNVIQQPEFEVESPQYICSNDLPKTLTVINPQGDYTYVWYRDGNALTGVVGLDIIGEVYNAGTYTVVATNANGSNCSTSREIEVLPSSIATITNIETDPGVLNSTITIDFEGESDDYEYNIDFQDFEDTNIVLLGGSEGEVYTYQTTIENPMGGNQTIRIRDRHGCGVAIENVCVLGFPKFFTPTGDNINDRWQVFGADECFDNAIVRIFDRYGKLVKQFSSGDEGWNGTYNGRQLPATDYWFTVEFADENFEVFKGHFSLKR